MPREIKFRAWVNVSNANTMLQNIDLEELWMSGRAYEDYGTSRYEAEDISGIKWTFKDLLFMQYTGLKDCKGKEIYEGDIVKDLQYSGQILGEYEVKYDENMRLRPFHEMDGWDGGGIWMEGRTYEVIGNIYERPRLQLEVQHAQ